MDGLIPFVLKALKKKKAMKHYRSLSSTDHLAHADVTELSPQGSFFMTPQHPRAPRWLDDEDDGIGEPPPPAPAAAAAAVPAAMARAKSSNTRRLPIMEAPPLRYGGSCHGGK
uniref:Uncharacterized protein n=1 Tax=Setaria viridis TaxID=4556 RepID=A0A4U6VLD2_SETVI|nr:hypothetical protein SEVIR_3G096150v2 [Setaria viridis]